MIAYGKVHSVSQRARGLVDPYMKRVINAIFKAVVFIYYLEQGGGTTSVNFMHIHISILSLSTALWLSMGFAKCRLQDIVNAMRFFSAGAYIIYI